MLVIKVELHSARTNKVTELGRMLISNDGTHSFSSRWGSYDVKLGRRGDTSSMGVYENPLRVGRVENHARKAYSVWRLVQRALEETLKPRARARSNPP